MTGRRRDLLPNSGGTKPPPHHRNQQSQHSTGNRRELAHKDADSSVLVSHDGRRVESPVNDRNFNSGNKLRTAAQHRDEPRKSAKHSRYSTPVAMVHKTSVARGFKIGKLLRAECEFHCDSLDVSKFYDN